MSASTLVETRAATAAFPKRRFLLWTATFCTIVGVMGIGCLITQAEVFPAVTGNLSAQMLLGVFLLSLVLEFVDSSLGMGYGTALTPVLMLLFGFELHQIVPCILLSEFLSGAAAGLMHHRDGNVDFVRDKQARWTVLTLSVLSVIGVIAGVKLATCGIPKDVVKTLVATIILVVGIITLVTARRRFQYRPRHMIVLGAVAAFNKALSGGGYGPLVTAGQVVSGLSPKQAIAITSMAESFTCLAGLLTYMAVSAFGTEHRPDWSLALPMALGALMSVPIATTVVRRLNETFLRTIVGAVTCLLAGLMFYKLFLG